MTEAREFDVVLYGATGFTGRQTVAYFAARAPAGLRWALAGRNGERLAAIAAEFPDAGGAPRPQIVCDSGDAAGVAAMAARTRVLLTTVGPYARYGQTLVEACVAERTHYVDITGETVWVRGLVDHLHAAAAATATRIVPFCGFDSVPSDLGTLIAVEHLRRAHGVGTRSVKAFHRGRGGVNGGTIASFLEMQASGQAAAMRDPILLNPPGMRGSDRPEAEADPWLPRRDPDLHAFAAPFVMGPINTRVVRRSAALAEAMQHPYGPGFRYQEYWKCAGPLALAEAAGFTWGQALFPLLAGIGPVRSLLERLLPAPGEGPSEAAMDKGFFRCELVAEGEDGRRILVTLSDDGDPGNRATVKMLCESALALALDGDDLPGAPHLGGILTPATALGLVLRRRLESAGMRISVRDPMH
ncbi:MAG TPA: saccharopine dehydrogenase NADP-binding domain-containing protein [Pseudomonadales bacterium]|nr:saccharopine dehydrogenase NADP-binding domain-containing protein [Pseudomonadales bacterium]